MESAFILQGVQVLDIPACSCLRADAPLQPRERRKVVHPWEVYRASRDLLVVKQVLLEKSEEVLCGFRTFCFHRALKSLQQWPEHGLAWSHGEAMFGGSWCRISSVTVLETPFWAGF